MNISIATKLLWALSELRRRDHWTWAELRAHQARELRALRNYVYTRSPFYQRFHREVMGRPLCELPVLTKALLMEHFDEIMTDRSVHLGQVEAHVAHLQGDARFLDRY